MAIPRPSTSDIKLVMADNGKMRLLYKGEPLPGIIKIESEQNPGERATVRATFTGLAGAFETEQPCKQAS